MPKSASLHPTSSLQTPASSTIYVNRGLGTIGAPVRLGVPPEITLLTLPPRLKSIALGRRSRELGSG